MSLAEAYQFKYPPEQQLCLKHRLATRIWKGIYDQNQNLQVCQCCGRKVGDEHIPTQCCYSSSQLSFLGVGLPLFFSFLRYSILLLIFLALAFCVFGLYSNITSKDCQTDSTCQSNIFNTLSIINKKRQNSYMSIQNYILLAFVIFSIFIFQFYRYRFRKIIDQIDQDNASPSDYSIILKRLPQQATQKDIQDMIDNRRSFLEQQQKIATNNLKVVKIIMSYNLNEFNQQKQICLKNFKQKIKLHQTKQFKKPQIPPPSIHGLIAIVIFEKQQSKQLFIQEPKCNQRFYHYILSPCAPLSDYRIKNKRICIRRAPQPDDILWNNACTTVGSGICRKLILGTISFMLLIIGGAAQYGLALLQKQVSGENQKLLIGTAASVLVTIVNGVLQYFLIYSTYWEKMNTITQYSDVLTFKLVFQQFLNAGIFVVGANILANYQTFNLQSNLAETITQIMLLNAVTPTVTNFLLYRFDISGRVMRYFCLKKKCQILTQLQANYLYVKPAPILPQKYSYIIKTIWLTAFYAPFVPIVVPISIIGFIFNYMVQKYLFGASYSAPNMISAQLNNSCIELFEYFPLILSVGQFVIYWYFKKFNFNEVPIDWSVPIYISIGISLLNLLLPMRQINKSLFAQRQDLSGQPIYSKVCDEFQVTYQITNPAYQSERPRLHDVYIWKKLFGHGPNEMRQLSGYKSRNENGGQSAFAYPLLYDNRYL